MRRITGGTLAIAALLGGLLFSWPVLATGASPFSEDALWRFLSAWCLLLVVLWTTGPERKPRAKREVRE